MNALRIGLNRREAVWWLGLLTGLLFGSALSGWLISRGDVGYLLALGAVVALGVVAVRARWLLVALLVLAVLNGIPGLNVADLHSAGTFNPATVCALLLVAVATGNFAFGRSAGFSRAGRWLFAWGAVFIALWLVAWVRAVGDGVPILKALTFGQAFLLFGLLLPVSPWLLRSRHEVHRFLTVFIGFALIYALGEIAASLSVISPSAINVSLTATKGGVVRLYAPMSEAVFLLLACSIGVAFVAKGTTARAAVLTAIVTGVAVAVGLTRAQYFALVGGLVSAFLIIGVRGPVTIKARIGWRSLCALGAGIAIAGALALSVPQLGHSSGVKEIVSRATTGLAQLSGQAPADASNTFAYRQSVDQSMLSVLGTRWPLGLGFLAPPTFYFVQLPSGSIMNTDVGVMNILMTQGVVGAALLYLPLLWFLAVAAAGLRCDDGTTGQRLGITIWLVAVLAASITLVTLFSTGGLVLVSLTIGVYLREWGKPGHQAGSVSNGAAHRPHASLSRWSTTG